jgi:hypothetical protein
MLAVHEFSADSTVTLLAGRHNLPASVECEIDRLWNVEQARRGKYLSNGLIFSAIEISPGQILGRTVEYRQWIAQRGRPELYDVLAVRPVAVAGLFECADGLIFGRRASTVTQDAGLWELVPSGGIDTSQLAPGEVNYRAQILSELHEELGCRSDSVLSATAFCLVEDLESHVLDIGIAMLAQLSAAEVFRTHHVAASQEYEELRVMTVADVNEFVEREASQLVPVSVALIRCMRDRRLCGYVVPDGV